MNPILFRNGNRLSRKESDRILKTISKSDCHLLGRKQPEGVEDRCLREVPRFRKSRGPNPGMYMGHGSCLCLKFIQRKSPCANCRARTIIEQLNWLFQNRARFEGLSAEWPKRRGDKGVS